jgi:multimeric flavodoxin WrbA
VYFGVQGIEDMGKRILAIYGSPREGGNTDTLMDHFLEGASEYSWGADRVYLRELDFTPCNECNGCEKTGRCVIRDELNPLFDKLLNYERVAFSYPVFFLGPPALTKAFMDRGQFLWVRRYVLNVSPVIPGADHRAFLMSVGGFKGSEKIFSCNRSILRSFLLVCGLKYEGELFVNGMEHREDVKQSNELCSRAREAGGAFVNS